MARRTEAKRVWKFRESRSTAFPWVGVSMLGSSERGAGFRQPQIARASGWLRLSYSLESSFTRRYGQQERHAQQSLDLRPTQRALPSVAARMRVVISGGVFALHFVNILVVRTEWLLA